MIKPRLFVFGDSWAFNYFSKSENLIGATPHFGSGEVRSYAEHYNYFGHWIDHMQTFYDVYSYGQGAASNEQIIFQLGNLQDYTFTLGDRAVVIFSTPERLNVVYKKKKYGLAPNGSLDKNLFPNADVIKFIQNQYIEREKRWEDASILKDEKKFISLLKELLHKWNPIFVTWAPNLNIDQVSCLPFSLTKNSIYLESRGMYKDWHLGINGNYLLFKLLSNKLSLDVSSYQYSFPIVSSKLL